MYQVQLFTLLGPRDVGGQKWVHESFEIWSPPLRQRVANLPLIVYRLPAELGAYGRQPLIEACLETGNLVILRKQVVAWSSRVSLP
jgi:hypothetical protein